MTLQEFKAWFEGFTEDMDAAPSKKQWERIKKRVKEIDGAVTTYPVFVDRYWPYHRTYFSPGTFISTVGCNTTVGSSETLMGNTVTVNVRDDGHSVFNSSQAMLALGKADYQSIS